MLNLLHDGIRNGKQDCNGVAQFLLFVFLNESIDRADTYERNQSKRLWIENPFKGIMVMDNSNKWTMGVMDDVYTFFEYK